MNLNELLHKIVDAVAWSSADNAAEAHATVDEHMPAPVTPPAEGTPS